MELESSLEVFLELEQAIRSRRSIRAYKDDPIARDDVEALLDSARLAPSSFNSQPWRFHVAMGAARDRVQDVLAQTTRYVGEYLQTLSAEEAEVAEEFFAVLGHAPVLIGVSVPVADNESDRVNDLLAVGGAMQNLQLAATGRGLGTCSITFSYWVKDGLADALDVEHGREIVSVILLGKPAETPESPGRRPSDTTYSE